MQKEMSSKFQLTNPIWNNETRNKRLGILVQASAAELEGEIKQTILSSNPSGRTYRRGRITKAVGKRGKVPVKGLKTFSTAKGNKRVVTGFNFHRASAPGQAPASDSGGLVNSVRAKKISENRAKVTVGKKYGAALDNGTVKAGRSRRVKIKARPFFRVTVEKFRPRFKVKISEVFKNK